MALICADCDGLADAKSNEGLFVGNGRCVPCRGKGRLPSEEGCPRCSGTGVCQTCEGAGVQTYVPAFRGGGPESPE